VLTAYLVLGHAGALAPEAAELSARTSSYEAISLQGLVILDVLLELAQRVSGRGAIGACSEERHSAAIGRREGGGGECAVLRRRRLMHKAKMLMSVLICAVSCRVVALRKCK
jgi:hypothetical protein